MQLDRIEIAGFNHFPRPAVLDLREIPSGIVAITGRNGHGKTRLQDAAMAALYGPGAPSANPRAFPSRDGSLATYATSRDAYIEALWSMDDGARYRCRVNVDGEKRNTDAVLEQLVGTDLLTDEPSGVALNDGKSTTYREAVAAVFPSRRQVLASVFAAQGRHGGFAALDQRGRMELFYELLSDLKAMEAMAETSRRCGAIALRAVDGLTLLRDSLTRDSSPETMRDVEAAIAETTTQVRLLTEGSGVLRQLADRLTENRAEASGRAREQAEATVEAAAARRAIEEASRALRDADADLVRLRTHLAGDRLRVEDRLRATVDGLARQRGQEEQALAKLLADREERIAGNLKLQQNRMQVEAAVRTKEQVAVQIVEHRIAIQSLRDRMVDDTKLLRELEEKIHRVEHDEVMLKTFTEQAAAIGKAPFGEKCEPCDFMVSATAAKQLLPELRASVETKAGLLTERAAWDDRQRNTAILLAARKEILEAAEKTLAEAEQWARYEPEMAHIAERVAQYRTEQEDARTATADRLADLDSTAAMAEAAAVSDLEELKRRESDGHADINRRMDEAAIRRQQATASLEEAEAKMERTSGAGEYLLKLDLELAEVQKNVIGNEVSRAKAEAALDVLNARAAEICAKAKRLTSAQDRLRMAEDEMLAWQLLAKALGRDGLPKLEVDASGPTVADLTNDLLAVGYGTRFTVDVVTQVGRADNKGLKEEFDILVFDNEHGGEKRSIGDLSGGESVMVDEALRGAIALFHNARNPKPIRTCWRDETTGALDKENRAPYVAMLRRIRQLGGFRHVLFVTHDLEAAAMADAWVRVENGAPTVTLPPYREEVA